MRWEGCCHSSTLLSAEVDPLAVEMFSSGFALKNRIFIIRVMAQLETAATAVRTLPIEPRSLVFPTSSSMGFFFSSYFGATKLVSHLLERAQSGVGRFFRLSSSPLFHRVVSSPP